MAHPRALAALLRCPRCHERLRNPTTLHCGHALCSHHLDAPAPSCPVPACAQTTRAPRIPPDSTVAYIPAAAPAPPIPVTEHRSDVSLNKIIALADRTLQRLCPDEREEEEEDSDDDDDRPRKRRRRNSSPDLLSHLQSVAARDRLVPSDVPLPSSDEAILADFDKRLLEELTCHICYVLFYRPVTTPCQHTYCAKCLQRSLDHNTTCPICRQELPPYLFQDQPTNQVIMSIILKAYPLLYQERGAAIDEEERHARLNTPIFVCNLSFPGLPTILHFFEPRYRLMLRRCLESPTPRFGMIMSPKPGSPQTDYGTILEIRSVQMLPDGRSMVETWGTSRFRILERGTLDGYMVGRIERIDDYADDLADPAPPSLPTPSPPPPSPLGDRPLLRRVASSLSSAASSSRQVAVSTISSAASSSRQVESLSTAPPASPTNAELMDTCRAFLDRLQRGAAPWVVQRLYSTHGAMPADPALFSFWVALVLPIEEYEKAKLLPIRSPRLRLLLVVHWIEQLNNNWYAPAAVRGLLLLLLCAVVLTGSRLLGWL